MSQITNIAKDYILVQRKSEPLYDNYSLFTGGTLPPTNQSDIHLFTESDSVIEDVHNFRTITDASSVMVLTEESPNNENEQVSHLITSIRIKGIVKSVHLTFAEKIIHPQEFPTNSLIPDDDGYIEILNTFAPFLPLFCVHQFDTLLRLKTQGPITVKVKKCRLSFNYISFLQLNQFPLTLPIVRTHASFTAIARTTRGETQTICIPLNQAFQDNKSLGLHIAIMNKEGEYINKKYIRGFVLTFADAFALFSHQSSQTHNSPFILSARAMHVSSITKTSHFNLPQPTKLNHGYYIPLTMPTVYENNQHIHLKVLLKTQITTSFTLQVMYFYQDAFTFYNRIPDFANEI
jgi:hypothetical protein